MNKLIRIIIILNLCLTIAGVDLLSPEPKNTLRPMAADNAGQNLFGALAISKEAHIRLQEIKRVIKERRFKNYIAGLLTSFKAARPGHSYVVTERIKSGSGFAKTKIQVAMIFSPRWFWRAKGVVFIKEKGYVIKSRHMARGSVDFDDLVVTSELDTGKDINIGLSDFLKQHRIKVTLEFEPVLVFVTKGKTGRYKIADLCNLHMNTISKDSIRRSACRGYFSKEKGAPIIRVEKAERILKGRQLIFETHMHLGDDMLILSDTDISNTTINGRLASHIIFNEKGEGKIYVPRQADIASSHLVPVLIKLCTDTRSVEAILERYYIIEKITEKPKASSAGEAGKMIGQLLLPEGKSIQWNFLRWVIPELEKLTASGYSITERSRLGGCLISWAIIKNGKETGLIRARVIGESVAISQFRTPPELKGRYDTAIFSLFLAFQNRWLGYKFKVNRVEEPYLEMRKEMIRFNIRYVNPLLRRSYIEGRVPYVETWVFEPILKTGIFDKPGIQRLDDIGDPAMFSIATTIESCA